jgi:hypothetical protein
VESARSRRHPNALFIWIPKTGGTSTFAMLRQCGFVKLKSVRDVERYFAARGRVTFGHMSVPALMDRGLVDQDFVASAFKFAVVRHPYSRAVSCFNHLNKRRYFAGWVRAPSFGEFLTMIHSGFLERIGAHNNVGMAFCNPQADWLRGLDLDLVLKLESLHSEIAALSEALGCDALTLGHANRSVGMTVDDLNSSDRLLIQEIYREDFERFGYPVD